MPPFYITTTTTTNTKLRDTRREEEEDSFALNSRNFPQIVHSHFVTISRNCHTLYSLTLFPLPRSISHPGVIFTSSLGDKFSTLRIITTQLLISYLLFTTWGLLQLTFSTWFGTWKVTEQFILIPKHLVEVYLYHQILWVNSVFG